MVVPPYSEKIKNLFIATPIRKQNSEEAITNPFEEPFLSDI